MVYFSIEVKKMVARLTKEQLNYFENPDFYQDYMEMFIFRLTFSNMSIERDLGEIADSKNAIRLRDNYRAFQKLLTMFSYDMSEDLIIDIANTIKKKPEEPRLLLGPLTSVKNKRKQNSAMMAGRINEIQCGLHSYIIVSFGSSFNFITIPLNSFEF